MVTKFKTYNLKAILWTILVVEVVVWAIAFNIYFFIFDGSEDARIENMQYFWFLIGIPVFSVYWYYHVKSKNEAVQQYANIQHLHKLTSEFSTLQKIVQYILLRNALFFAIIGLSNPQYGKGKAEAKRQGIDLVIALDVSNSMLAEDMGNGNRLANAKRAIERLITRLKGDRIGLVIFAGDAFVQIPVTNDYGAAKLFLSGVSTDMLSAQGTAIGRALSKSVELFDLKSPTKKAIVLISDGENHEDDAEGALQNAVSNNINVYTIGVGSTVGSPIPRYVNGEKEGVRRDEEGNTVITKLNEKMLMDLSAKGNGLYIKAGKNQFGLDPLFNEINKMEKKEYETVSYTDYDDQFFYFIWIAVVFLLIEFLIGYLNLIKA